MATDDDVLPLQRPPLFDPSVLHCRSRFCSHRIGAASDEGHPQQLSLQPEPVGGSGRQPRHRVSQRDQLTTLLF